MSVTPHSSIARDVQTLWQHGALGSLADAELARRFLSGPRDVAEAAFEVLVARHGDMVLRVCGAVLRDAHAAQDAAQVVFLVLARRMRTIRQVDSLGPWLHRVAIRTAKRARALDERRRAREQAVAQRIVRESAMNVSHASTEHLHDALNALPERFRAPIVLCELEGRTQEQAAHALGWKLGTLQSRLHRGRQKLKERLRRHGVLSGAGLAVTAGTRTAAVDAAWIGATARAAAELVHGGGWVEGVSPGVVELTQGVMRMFLRDRIQSIALAVGAVMLTGGISWGVLRTGTTSHAPVESVESAPAARNSVAQERPRAQVDLAQDAPRVPVGVTPLGGTGDFEVRGVVVDEDRKPVSGARVRLVWYVENPPTAVSDANGAFVLRAKRNGSAHRYRGASVIAEDAAGERIGHANRSGLAPDTSPLEVMLKPAQELRAIVVNSEGAAVEGAAVEVLAWEELKFEPKRTDGKGVATFRIPGDTWVNAVIALKDGVGADYYEHTQSSPARPESKQPPPSDVRLVLDGARDVRAKLVDTEGKPVPGVRVCPWYFQKLDKLSNVNVSGRAIASVTTDAEGIATFRWMPRRLLSGSTVPIHVHSDRYHLIDRAKALYFSDATDDPLVIEVAERVMMTGRVLGPDNKPAAGVVVVAAGTNKSGDYWPYLTTTDADGTYVMDVPPELHYIVTVVNDRWSAPAHPSVTPELGKSVGNIDFLLNEGAVLKGRVTKKADGTPVAGHTIVVVQLGDPFSFDPNRPDEASRRDRTQFIRWVETDAQGNYSLHVGAGDFQLGSQTAMPSEPQMVKVETGEVAARDFVLDEGTDRFANTHQIAGTVVDDAGRPLPGALLTVASMDAGTVRSLIDVQARTDANGHFEAWGKGRIVLVARSPDARFAAIATFEADGPVERTIQLKASATVTGQVFAPNGLPADGDYIAISYGPDPVDPASYNQGPIHAQTYADAEGRYRFEGLPPGVFAIVFVYQQPRESRPQRIEVADGGEHVVPDVRLKNEPLRKGDR